MSVQNAMALKQARAGIQSLIDANRTIIEVLQMPKIINGKGDIVDDPYGVPVPIVMRCRISHELAGTFNAVNIQGAVTSNQGRYILTNHNNLIEENQTFEAIGTRWKIGHVDPLYAFGRIIGYQAPLIQAVLKVSVT